MAAFHTNGMLLAQFPTPAVRKGLWMSLVDKVVKEIRDPQWEVLVAREADDRVVSFAKWCLPLSESTVYEEEPWVWPEGTNMAILNAWVKKVEQAAKEIMGKTPCYRLSFIATDPSYALRGAGSLLVNWGIERSKEENIPIALESTLDAVPFYQRLGFQTEARVSMPLEGIGKDGEAIL
ncbi:acetyltransferase GNAT, partial [Aspergillus fumigatus]